MRIDSLRIREFKNLRNFSVTFDANSPISVLVGRNGTGKSNLLEALTIIFRDLDLERPPAFSYNIRYEVRQQTVSIDADPDRRPAIRVRVNGQIRPRRLLNGVGNARLLPDFVFGYYSGPSNRMRDHFGIHQERFYRSLLRGQEQTLRRLFFARPVHGQFVLLTFFLQDLRIEALDSVLVVIRQPPWTSESGNRRFWNARGTVSELLDHLHENALAPIRLIRRIELGFRRSTSREHVYLYLPDVTAVRRISEAYPRQQDFFKALESTFISEMLSEVRITVRSGTQSGKLSFRELSEGEQQLLTVLGLLRFTKEDEALFLLDEPDTHLNAAWSLQYRALLMQYGGVEHRCQLLMATHDPLVIAGLWREQVQVFRRNRLTGIASAQQPEEHPRGMGVAALLTSDVYGLKSQLDPETLRDLERKRALAAAQEVLTPAETAELAHLSRELQDLDFSNTVRDPLYREFVEAMSQLEGEAGLDVPILTPEQQDRQRELAVRVLKELTKNSSGAVHTD